MDQILLFPIFLPVIAAILCLLLRQRNRRLIEGLALLVTLVTFGLAIYIFTHPDLHYVQPWLALTPDVQVNFDLLATPLARLALLAAAGFAVLVALYSLHFLETPHLQEETFGAKEVHPRHKFYYAYLLAALGVSAGVVLANNLVLLLFFWELLGLSLYLMVMVSGDAAIPSAAKTLLIATAGDMLFMLGIILVWLATGSLSVSALAATPLALDDPLTLAAFACMLGGAFAKAGIMPLHTWIPAISTQALPPVMSFFTALDKVVGIYLLASLTLQWFIFTPAVSLFLMGIGAITLLGGVLMAMIQHDYRRMLAFHNVSQVGYMVLGIGTGTPIGVIGGLFHMINMVILKGNLFLCGGAVQRQTGQTEFDELGGLAKPMPWTFGATLIAALGISGVPPLNAFVSKWMIYLGVLDQRGPLYPIFLLVAMFGSALTLASFMKLMYSIFWGGRPDGLKQVKEAPRTMLIPMVLLAFLAVALGVIYFLPLDNIFKPLFPVTAQATLSGLWQSELAVILLALSLAVGIVIFLGGKIRPHKEVEVFVGGEAIDPNSYRVRGSHFYGPIKEMNGLRQLYALAEKGAFDIYNYGVRFVTWAARLVYEYVDQALTDFYQEVIPSLLSLNGQILRSLNTRSALTLIMWALYALGALGIILMPDNEQIIKATRIIACVGMIGFGILAMVETDLRRLLLLAATSQLGFIVLGATLSGPVALSYLLTGGLAWLVLFTCGLWISRSQHTADIRQMSGLASKMPLAFLVFLIAALWMSGLPPFGSFFSKYLLGMAAGEISPFLTIVVTGTALLTLGYLLRPIRRFLRSG